MVQRRHSLRIVQRARISRRSPYPMTIEARTDKLRFPFHRNNLERPLVVFETLPIRNSIFNKKHKPIQLESPIYDRTLRSTTMHQVPLVSGIYLFSRRTTARRNDNRSAVCGLIFLMSTIIRRFSL